MTEKPDTRQIILDAAFARVMHYGYAKTTMAEIAKDCGMSAGNIYRFFASKLDIAEAMARTLNAEINSELAGVVRRSGTASEKLRKIHHMELQRTYDKLASDAKVMEVAEILSNERPTFANEELADRRVHLVKVLEQGMESGEFSPLEHTDFAGEMIQSATMKFCYPQLWTKLTLPQLQRELDGVLDIILSGLKSSITFTAPESVE